MDLNIDLTTVSQPQSAAKELPQHRHRTGLIPLTIDSSWMTPGPDDRKRQYLALDRGAVLAAAKGAGRSLTVFVRDLTTGRDFATLDELRAAVGDDNGMRDRRETHVWAYISWDPARGDHAAAVEALDAEIEGRKATIALLIKAMRTPKTMQDFDADRERKVVQEKALETAIADRARLALLPRTRSAEACEAFDRAA
jgi:hypothetical protein